MSQNSWYVKRGPVEEGPFTFVELVDLARRGCLAPRDTVREGVGPWCFVDSVRGLQVPIRRLRSDLTRLNADAPRQWCCQALGLEMGPIHFDEISRMIASGQLTEDDKVRPVGEMQWRRVVDCPEFCSNETTWPTSGGKSDQPASTPGIHPDSWFYRWDERVYGPVAWNELLDLFSHSKELAREARIRRADSQEWLDVDVDAHSQILLTRTRDTPPPRACADGAGTFTSAKRQSQAGLSRKGRQRVEGMGGGNGSIVAAIVLWILINAGALYFLSDPYAHERQYLAELHKIVDEAHSLQAREASTADWKDFRKRANESLADMVKRLKKTAGPSKPLHQQLLWAARDEIPRILGPKSLETEKRQKELETHLKSVESAIASPLTPMDSTTR